VGCTPWNSWLLAGTARAVLRITANLVQEEDRDWARGNVRTGHTEAIAVLEQALAISRDAFSMAYLGSAHVRAGNFDAARSILKDLLAMSEREAVPPRCFVCLYGELGEPDRAFDWLERAYEARDSWLFFLRVIPLYDPVTIRSPRG
jgi:tetratricopeptide (TPR) repeat protein